MDVLSRIEARTSAIVDGRGDWPCRKGCDQCCRHLADLPQLTPDEWLRLRPAVLALPALVHARILAATRERPVTCPLLHRDSGACLVYADRPVACRAYGFYVERDRGLYCGEIADGVERGAFEGVVWGNWESVAPAGETRDLAAWFRDELAP